MDQYIAAIEDSSVSIVINNRRVLRKTCKEGEEPLLYTESELGKGMRILQDSYASRNNQDRDPTRITLDNEKPQYIGAIAQYESMSKTTKSAKASPIELPKAYKEYTDVFSKEGAATLVRYDV